LFLARYGRLPTAENKFNQSVKDRPNAKYEVSFQQRRYLI
jgi:hypothetical protein